MSDAQRRKDDDRVAVGVAGAVVMELDALGAGENRHSVPCTLVRQKGRILPLEEFHLLHVRLGVLLRDDLD